MIEELCPAAGGERRYRRTARQSKRLCCNGIKWCAALGGVEEAVQRTATFTSGLTWYLPRVALQVSHGPGLACSRKSATEARHLHPNLCAGL